MKSLFSSRTFIYNLLSGLSLFFLLPELQELVGPGYLKFVLLANATINIVLRYLTTQPVDLSMPSGKETSG